jgi:DNA-binding transcriptional LysR family regulator
MELSDLVTFATVARCGGITRAAGELATVQSNVTNRIKALEAELGVVLFERHSRGMMLTTAGKRLLPYVQRVAVLTQEAAGAARDQEVPAGTLSIGSMETTAAVRLPSLLARFHKEYPAVRLNLTTGPTDVLVESVLEGVLDGGFVCGPVNHPDLTVRLAFKEELVLVTAARWTSIAALRKGTTTSGPSALVFRTGCSYRQRLEQLLADFGWPTSSRFEFGTLDGIIGCVAADMGVTLLPRAVIERQSSSRDIRAHAVNMPFKMVETLFIRRRAGCESAALKRFGEIFGQNTRQTARRS